MSLRPWYNQDANYQIETHNQKTSQLNGIGLSLEGLPVKTIVPHSRYTLCGR